MSVARPRRVVSESDDDEEPILLARTSVKKKASVVNPAIVGNDDDDAPSSFKRASTYVRYKPLVVNPVVVANDDYAAPRSFNKATTYAKNRTWKLHSSRRASASLKSWPTLSRQKALGDFDLQMDRYHARFSTEDSEKDEDLDRLIEQYHNDPQLRIEDSEGDEKTPKSEDNAKSGTVNAGRPKKKHKGTTSIPTTEDSMIMGQKASQQGQQYSISRCLEVLHGMDDVSDEIKILASDVLKDAASREFFLCYESRLRGLWLKKEVAKLGAQLPS